MISPEEKERIRRLCLPEIREMLLKGKASRDIVKAVYTSYPYVTKAVIRGWVSGVISSIDKDAKKAKRRPAFAGEVLKQRFEELYQRAIELDDLKLAREILKDIGMLNGVYIDKPKGPAVAVVNLPSPSQPSRPTEHSVEDLRRIAGDRLPEVIPNSDIIDVEVME